MAGVAREAGKLYDVRQDWTVRIFGTGVNTISNPGELVIIDQMETSSWLCWCSIPIQEE